MTDGDAAGRCAWCESVAPDGATRCRACGASLAQREDLGGLVIPGVTAVDPALEAWAAQPTHVRGNSPSQSVASSAIAAVALGGPVAVIAVGGLVAVAASELLGAHHDGPTTPEELADLGRPSDAALQVAASLDAADKAGDGDSGTVDRNGPGPHVDGTSANSDNSTRD